MGGGRGTMKWWKKGFAEDFLPPTWPPGSQTNTLATKLESAVPVRWFWGRRGRKRQGGGKDWSIWKHSPWTHKDFPSGMNLKKAPGYLRPILRLSLLTGESVHAYDGWLGASAQVCSHLLMRRNRLLGLLEARAERRPTLFFLSPQHPNNFPY